jgi:phosphotriesterase-related protein
MKKLMIVFAMVLTMSFTTAVALCVRVLSGAQAVAATDGGGMRIVLDAGHGGIDGGVKPGMIGEIGTSKGTMTETEKKVFDASVIAAKETGLPIYTHTTLGTYAPEQAAYFKATGLPMDRIVLGHLDLSGDLDYIRRVLDYGVSIGFDTVGKNNYFPDAKRVEFLLALEAEGRLDQIVLSEDLTRKSHLKYKGGIGYCYLFETFLPMLKEAGLKQESLDTMLIHNPARILGV